jgi:hypothetical protein
MTHLGFHYQIKWTNPYTSPNGPVVKAEMFESLQQREMRVLAGENLVPEEISKYHQIGDGYGVYISSVKSPYKTLSIEKLAVIRKKRLQRRMLKKYPLFADQFIKEETERKPDYYMGYTDKQIEENKNKILDENKKYLAKFFEAILSNKRIIVYQ